MSNEVNTKKLPLPQLPEGCIAKIISFTSPKDACRLAAVSLGFRSAADSDAVCEHFLPPNYGEIVSRASPSLPFSNKKHLYFLLHDASTTLFLDGGKISFELNKSVEKSYMLSARALEIASVDNPRHWEWTSLPESSRFAEVAKLQSIERLEIRGVMPARMLSPNTKYAAWLIFRPCYGFSGLDRPSKALIKFARGDGTELVGETTKIYIQCSRHNIMNFDARKSWCLQDDWEGIELGEFFIGEGAADYDVHILVSETEHLDLKSGLIIEGIELIPSHEPAVPPLSVLRDWS